MGGTRLSPQRYGQFLTCKLGTVRDWGQRALHGPGQSTPMTYEGTSAPCHVRHSHGVAEAQGMKPAVTGLARQAGGHRNRSSTWRENARVLTPWGGDRAVLPAEPPEPLCLERPMQPCPLRRRPQSRCGTWSLHETALRHKRHRPRLHQTCTRGDVRADPESQGRARPPRMGVA